jgi:hypothetical protein
MGSNVYKSQEFWTRDRLTIAAKTGSEFQRVMHACLRAAPNWASVERLRDDNAVLIAQLDRATKDDVLAMMKSRWRELRNA